MVVQEQTGDHCVPGMLALDVTAALAARPTSWLNSSRTAQAMASPLFGAQSTPQRSGTISASAPARTATTGMPLAIASSATRPKVSWSPACSSASLLASRRATSRLSQKWSTTLVLRGTRVGMLEPTSNR